MVFELDGMHGVAAEFLVGGVKGSVEVASSPGGLDLEEDLEEHLTCGVGDSAEEKRTLACEAELGAFDGGDVPGLLGGGAVDT